MDNDAKADWCCHKIDQHRTKRVERAKFAETETARLLAWQEQADEQDRGAIGFFEGLLRPYFVTLRESGSLGNRKSYRLPHGMLKVRSQPPRFERDNAKLRAWAVEVGLVRAPELDCGTIKRRGLVCGNQLVDTETGEVVPGVVVLEQPEVFTVTTGGE